MQNCVSKKLQRRTPQRVQKSFSKGSSAFYRIMMFFAFKSYVIVGSRSGPSQPKTPKTAVFRGKSLKPPL